MKRWIHASEDLREKKVLELLDQAQEEIRDRCEERGQGEYVDDVRYGNNKFQINIFVGDPAQKRVRIGSFVFGYDPYDSYHRSPEEQLGEQLDEFFQWDFPERDS